MSSQFHVSAEVIDQIDRLLDSIESLGKTPANGQVDKTLDNLKRIVHAHSVSLWVQDEQASHHAGGNPDSLIVSQQQWTSDAVHRVESDRVSVLATASLLTGSKVVLQANFESAEQCAEIDEIALAVVDAYANVLKIQQIGHLKQQASQSSGVNEFCLSLHACKRMDLLTSQIATDGASLLGVDRVSVVRVDRLHAEVQAVTAVSEIDQRANETQFLKRTAIFAVQNADALQEWKNSESLAKSADVGQLPQSSRYVKAICDSPGADSQHVLLLEKFDRPGPWSESQGQLTSHSLLALRNLDQAGSSGVIGSARKFGRRLRSRRFLSAMAIAGLVGLALTFIPATLQVECAGFLQPTRQQFVITSATGMVIDLCENEQKVSSGDLLLSVESSQLDLERSRIKGELLTAEARLQTLKASRGIPGANDSLVSTAETQEQIKGLNAQLKIVDSEIQKLSVHAIHDGVVFLQEPETDLAGTTIVAGQKVLQNVDVDGQWQVELRVPVRLIRHVTKAHREEERPTVRLMLRSNPSIVFSGELMEVGQAADIDVRNELTVPAVVRFDATSFKPTPGSEVLAKIDCGRRSIGFVMFREVIEFVQGRFLF